jgi:hypothetical protein
MHHCVTLYYVAPLVLDRRMCGCHVASVYIFLTEIIANNTENKQLPVSILTTNGVCDHSLPVLCILSTPEQWAMSNIFVLE